MLFIIKLLLRDTAKVKPLRCFLPKNPLKPLKTTLVFDFPTFKLAYMLTFKFIS